MHLANGLPRHHPFVLYTHLAHPFQWADMNPEPNRFAQFPSYISHVRVRRLGPLFVTDIAELGLTRVCTTDRRVHAQTFCT